MLRRSRRVLIFLYTGRYLLHYTAAAIEPDAASCKKPCTCAILFRLIICSRCMFVAALVESLENHSGPIMPASRGKCLEKETPLK